MAKKHKCPECPAGEKWAVPYADFLSLLLALFIALWAISKTNPAKVEALKTEFIKIFDFTATQVSHSPTKENQSWKASEDIKSDETNKYKQMAISQQKIIAKLQANLDNSVNKQVLDLPSRVEFARGSADIVSDDIKDYLKRMAELIAMLPPQIEIEIRGYTDNSDTVLRSYELAYARAENVLKYLVEGGVNTKNVSLRSYGLNEPLNQDASSTQNNRVQIYLKINPGDNDAKKSVLDLIDKIK